MNMFENFQARRKRLRLPQLHPLQRRKPNLLRQKNLQLRRSQLRRNRPTRSQRTRRPPPPPRNVQLVMLKRRPLPRRPRSQLRRRLPPPPPRSQPTRRRLTQPRRPWRLPLVPSRSQRPRPLAPSSRWRSQCRRRLEPQRLELNWQPNRRPPRSPPRPLSLWNRRRLPPPFSRPARSRRKSSKARSVHVRARSATVWRSVARRLWLCRATRNTRGSRCRPKTGKRLL